MQSLTGLCKIIFHMCVKGIETGVIMAPFPLHNLHTLVFLFLSSMCKIRANDWWMGGKRDQPVCNLRGNTLVYCQSNHELCTKKVQLMCSGMWP